MDTPSKPKRDYTKLDFEERGRVWKAIKAFAGTSYWYVIRPETVAEFPDLSLKAGNLWHDKTIAKYATRKLGVTVSGGNVKGLRKHYKLNYGPKPVVKPTATPQPAPERIPEWARELIVALAEHRINNATTQDEMMKELQAVKKITLALANQWKLAP